MQMFVWLLFHFSYRSMRITFMFIQRQFTDKYTIQAQIVHKERIPDKFNNEYKINVHVFAIESKWHLLSLETVSNNGRTILKLKQFKNVILFLWLMHVIIILDIWTNTRIQMQHMVVEVKTIPSHFCEQRKKYKYMRFGHFFPTDCIIETEKSTEQKLKH